MIYFSFIILSFFLAQTGRGKGEKGINEGRALKKQCAVGMSVMGAGREEGCLGKQERQVRWTSL